MIIFSYIEVEQPVGIFLLGRMSAEDIYYYSKSHRRDEYNNGIQRKLNRDRVKSIASYCLDPDAIFPTPIILSLNSKYVEIENEKNTLKINTDEMRRDNVAFSIVDGQHRIEGIYESGFARKFVLPTIIILDTTVEQDAYIFSVINGNQKSVSKSLIYDLFSLSDSRSIEKVCNYIVKELNSDRDSPIYGRIKMLGVKSNNSPNSTVSQALFIDSLIPYISKNTMIDNTKLKKEDILTNEDPNIQIFREYFLNENDHIIYKVLYNYFTAIKMVEEDLDLLDKKEVLYLNKTVGYMAKFQLLRPLFIKGRDKEKNLSINFFKAELKNIIEEYKRDRGKQIINDSYGSSASGAKQLFSALLTSWVNFDGNNKEYINDMDSRKLH